MKSLRSILPSRLPNGNGADDPDRFRQIAIGARKKCVHSIDSALRIVDIAHAEYDGCGDLELHGYSLAFNARVRPGSRLHAAHQLHRRRWRAQPRRRWVHSQPHEQPHADPPPRRRLPVDHAADGDDHAHLEVSGYAQKPLQRGRSSRNDSRVCHLQRRRRGRLCWPSQIRQATCARRD